MKFSVGLPSSARIPPVPEWVPGLTAADYQRFIRVVDELRYDAIVVPEHLALPLHEVPRLGPYWLDALTAMAFIAGASRRVRVDATVLVLPYHHPVKIAKAIATLDVLSGGRVNFSLGVGHAEKEFEILGVPFHERGKYTDESLAAIAACWASEEPVFHGDYFHIEGIAFQPHPVQQPRPPITIGGNAKPALRRAARHDGWQPNPTRITMDDLGPMFDYLKAQPEYQAKADTFRFHWVGLVHHGFSPEGDWKSSRDQWIDAIGDLVERGFTATSLPPIPTATFDEHLETLRWLDAEVLSAFP